MQGLPAGLPVVRPRPWKLLFLGTLVGMAAACSSEDGGGPSGPLPPPPPPPFEPAESVMTRLTETQYRKIVVRVLGVSEEALDVEPDTNAYLFASIGASTTTVSEQGVALYENGAADLAKAALAPARRQRLVGCEPALDDAACTTRFLGRLGRLLFRRTLRPAEVARYVDLAQRVGVEADSPWLGVETALTAMLQSPWFLYRIEFGEPDPADPSRLRYTSVEMASRLAFLFWNEGPDEALLGAAERGELYETRAIRAQAERLWVDPRSREAVRGFFSEYLGLEDLDALSKPSEVFPQMTDTLGASMRREIEYLTEEVAVEQGANLFELLDTGVTFVNRELANLYGVNHAATDPKQFTRVVFPPDGRRGGLLTTAGILALTSHATETSPTRRGRFVRQRLLCEPVPDPPPGVVAQLEPTTQALTLRERLKVHRENPICASCHRLTDPVGLGFEEFDAIGAWREFESGRPVDTTGDLDGFEFSGPRELGAALRERGEFANCLTLHAYRAAVRRLEIDSEQEALLEVQSRFRAGDYRYRDLLFAIATSEGFRYAAPAATEPVL